MKIAITCLSLFFLSTIGNTQTLTGSQLLENSIRYHDPKGKWDKKTLHFNLRETRPGAADRKTKFRYNQRKGAFHMLQHRENYSVERVVTKKKCEAELLKSDAEVQEDPSKINLSCDHCKLLRNYYTYLWLLPMKLKDPGTHVDEAVENGEFQGKPCYTLKVTYDEAVGKDVWYFYFDKSTYALTGYRFYHDETKNDGEYITLKGEVEINGILFPKKRSWYMNADGKFLGADILDKKTK